MCAGERPFEVPPQLADAFVDGNVVIFAGAGVSTEAPLVFPRTLYSEIAAELGIDAVDGPSFPHLMSLYEERHQRMALLARIKQRLDYAKSFPEVDRAASRFHQELATAFTVDSIVTTNWDDYFERGCGATPFVTDMDWAYWRSSGRKVFKLHGSINSPGSMVATEADYERCYASLAEGQVGAELKKLLATKTVVFVGYSFQDSDFNAIYEIFAQRMQELLPKAYIVTLDESDPPAHVDHMHVIRTDGTYFVRKLKELYPEDEFIPDARVEAAPAAREFVRIVHHHMLDQGEMREDGEMYVAASYHDGLIHAFDHQMANRVTGQYSHRCYVLRQLEIYRELQEEKLAVPDYIDVAYIEGYLNGLAFLVVDADERASLPLYYVFGYDDEMATYDEFRQAAAQAPTLHPEAHEQASERAARLAPGVVWQHLAFL